MRGLGGPTARVWLGELSSLAAFVLGKLGLTTAGDLLVATGASTFARLAKGADGTFLQVASGNLTWGSAPGGGTPDDNSVSTIKIQDGAVTHDKLDNGAVQTTNSQGNAVTGPKIANGVVSNSHLAGMAASTVKGKALGGGSGSPSNLTKAELRAIVLDSMSAATITDDDTILFRDTSDSGSGQGITAADLAAYVGSKIGSGAGNVELVAEDVDSSERTTTSTSYAVAHSWTPTVPADGDYFVEFFMASGSSSNTTTVRVDVRLDPTAAATGGTKLDDLGAGLTGQADIALAANGNADRSKAQITSQTIALTAGTSHTLEAAIRKTGGAAVSTLDHSRFRLWRVHS